MAKKEGMLDDVGDAPAEGPVGSTTPADTTQEASGGTEQPEATDERPNPAAAADRPDGYVPEQSLREARDELKAVRRQLRERDKQYGTLEERTNIILKRLSEDDGQGGLPQGGLPQASARSGQAAQSKSKTPPKPDENIFGWAENTGERLQRLEQANGQQQHHTEQQQLTNQLINAYQADAQRFRSEKPDFDQAYAHIMQAREAELLNVWGITDPARRQAQIEADELQIAAAAFQREISPAEMVYQLAQTRGYQPQPGQQQNGGANLSRIARGQEQNRSLSGAAGAPSASGLDAKALSRMSEEQIHELMRTRSGRLAVDKAMGLQN